MHLSRILITAAALSLPLSASAASVEMRHNGAGEACQGDAGKKGAKLLAKWEPGLGGDDTRKAWKSLRGAGEAGCDAIATWLKDGAPGEDADTSGWMLSGGRSPGLARASSSSRTGIPS